MASFDRAMGWPSYWLTVGAPGRAQTEAAMANDDTIEALRDELQRVRIERAGLLSDLEHLRAELVRLQTENEGLRAELAAMPKGRRGRRRKTEPVTPVPPAATAVPSAAEAEAALDDLARDPDPKPEG